jgi:hypothetical protein
VVARVIVFGMLAIDALLQIRHAARSGAGGFNVGQLPLIGALQPGRTGFAVAELVEAYMFVLIACGVATRRLLPIATVIYAWLYFSSQLDSYQHHYLVALLLLIACFVPWQRPDSAAPDTRVRTWAVRLALVQLGIMYLWAAISKLDPLWLDGTTLAKQLGGVLRHWVDATIGIHAMAWLVVITELALAATVWIRPAWWFAAPVGIAFHVGIALSGLEIGLFAWLMVALYILVVPDVVWVRLAQSRPLRFLREAISVVASYYSTGWVSLAGAVLVGLVLAGLCRLPSAFGVAAVLVGALVVTVVLARVMWDRRTGVAWIAIAHVFALATWVTVDRATTVTVDYYRLWGGTERRLGDREAAERVYRMLIDAVPREPAGHLQLGRLLLDRNDATGLEALHEAARLDPAHARAQIYEARWLASHGRRDEALVKAREAVAADPDDRDAKNLLTRLTAGKPAPTRDTVPPSED